MADEAVKNLAQVEKGDVVTATYTEALAYEVKKGGAAGVVAAAGGGTAKPGAKPAAGLGRTITVVVVSHQDRREGSVGNLQGSKRRNAHGQGPGTGETRGCECR